MAAGWAGAGTTGLIAGAADAAGTALGAGACGAGAAAAGFGCDTAAATGAGFAAVVGAADAASTGAGLACASGLGAVGAGGPPTDPFAKPAGEAASDGLAGDGTAALSPATGFSGATGALAGSAELPAWAPETPAGPADLFDIGLVCVFD